MIKTIIDNIKELFPDGAEFKIDVSIPNEAAIFWKLNNDQKRPNKTSKIIILKVSDEFAEDYRDGSDNTKISMDAKIPAFITQKLIDFDPDHSTPYSEEAPKEIWLISSM